MKKAISLMLVFFLTTGFGWGRFGAQEEEPEPTPTPRPAVSAYRTQEQVVRTERRAVYDEEDETPSRVQTSEMIRTTETTGGGAAGEAVIPTELTRALASGDKEEVKRKMESLRRLSLALQRMNQAKGGGAAPAE